jgi:DNA-binding transcriptional MerR regulator/methylmalonyl-CoA mutase cobalamin-binding subunit
MESVATEGHAIGVVARRTGLKPDLIRAWERRYGAVEPTRSEGRHRLYSDADVERLTLLKRAVEGGRSIGSVADRPNEELHELIAGDRPPAAAPTSQGADEIVSACLEAVRDLDGQALQLHLERGAVALSRSELLLGVVVPLMRRIGELWRQGDLRPIHEHLASGVVRTFVGGLGSSRPGAEGAPALVVTTPTGQRHELGALIVAACAREEGWRVVYLGTDLPAEEIAAAAARTGARAVALSLTFPVDDPLLRVELERLGRLLPRGTRLLVGGHAASGYRAALEAAGARILEDVPAFRRELTSSLAG